MSFSNQFALSAQHFILSTQLFFRSTGNFMSEALILKLVNPPYDDRLLIDWFFFFHTEVWKKKQVQNMFCTKLFWMPKQKQETIFVHTMFWTCIFLVLKSGINKQSVFILWVNWFKNESFWHRFSCTLRLVLLIKNRRENLLKLLVCEKKVE